jgi:hypothetical protein
VTPDRARELAEARADWYVLVDGVLSRAYAEADARAYLGSLVRIGATSDLKLLRVAEDYLE